MFFKLSCLLLSVAFLKVIVVQSLSWCDPELCPHGIQHIACDNTGVSIKKFIQEIISRYI